LFDLIAFDADDTLWVNEELYREIESQYVDLLSPFCPPEITSQKLFETEMANLPLYGYGAKSFTLSMVQTALELSRGQVRASDIQQIIDWVKAMLAADKPLLPGVQAVIQQLSTRYPLMLLTKGDLVEQHSKLACSGLAQFFQHVEIVPFKEKTVYQNILDRLKITPSRFLMVGNSLKSDVLPVVALGGHGVHIPATVTWAHEQVDSHNHGPEYHTLSQISELPGLLEQLEKTGG